LALQKSFSDDSVSFSEAYFRVKKIRSFNRDSKSIEFSVEMYKDKATRDADKQNYLAWVKTFRVCSPWVSSQIFDEYFSIEKLSETNNNIIKQCYEYLKSLSEFEGAISV
jgi:hypothetical protein